MADEPAQYEAKGLMFVTALAYYQRRFGIEAVDHILAGTSEETRAAFEDTLVNAWYPERHLRDLVVGVHRELVHGDDAAFLELMREVALSGINRFFRVVMSMASARFTLKKAPVLYTRLRRGPSKLVAEFPEDSRVLIHYHDYPYAEDGAYRLVSVANCQALVVASNGYVPTTRIVEAEGMRMTLEIELRK